MIHPLIHLDEMVQGFSGALPETRGPATVYALRIEC